MATTINAAAGGNSGTSNPGAGAGATVDVSELAKAYQLPTALGQKSGAQSVSVVLSSDGPFSTSMGLPADAAAGSDTGSASLISLFKRLLQNIATILNYTGVARVIASDGLLVPIDSLAQTNTFNGPNGALDTVSVVYGGNTYKQSLGYVNGNLTSVGNWMKQ